MRVLGALRGEQHFKDGIAKHHAIEYFGDLLKLFSKRVGVKSAKFDPGSEIWFKMISRTLKWRILLQVSL
jgi:hypothetical protein